MLHFSHDCKKVLSIVNFFWLKCMYVIFHAIPWPIAFLGCDSERQSFFMWRRSVLLCNKTVSCTCGARQIILILVLSSSFFLLFFPNCSSDATYKCDYMMKISVVARILFQLNCFIVRTEILEILNSIDLFCFSVVSVYILFATLVFSAAVANKF